MHCCCPDFISRLISAGPSRWPRLVCLFGLFAVAAVQAQTEEAEPEPETPAEHATALLEELDESRERVADLRAGLEGKTGESERLQIRQIQQEELRNGAIAHELAELLIAAGDDVEELGNARQDILELMRNGPAGIERVLDERVKLLERRQRLRDQAPTDEAVELQEAVTFAERAVDDVYRFYARHIRLMGKLDLDTEAARASLTERLETRAAALAAKLSVLREDGAAVQERLDVSPDDAGAKSELALLTVREKNIVEALRQVVDMLQDLDADTAEYQEILFTVTGDVSDIGLDAEVVTGLLDEWLSVARDWLRTDGWSFVLRVAIVLLILCGAWMLARLTRALVYKALIRGSAGMSRLLQSMLAGVVGNLVLILGALVALAQLGISIGPMLAGLGIAGFIVGFALQDTLGNFASGIMILLYRPFDEGDVIEAAGVSGKVQAMNLVSTTVLTFDNQTLIVPNSKIWGDVIRNVTHQRNRRVDLEFRIGHDADLEVVDKLFQEALASDDRVLDEPRPIIRLHSIDDSAYVFIVRPWVSTSEYWSVYWDLTRNIQERLIKAGLSRPRLQRDVYLHSPGGDGTSDSTPL